MNNQDAFKFSLRGPTGKIGEKVLLLVAADPRGILNLPADQRLQLELCGRSINNLISLAVQLHDTAAINGQMRGDDGGLGGIDIAVIEKDSAYVYSCDPLGNIFLKDGIPPLYETNLAVDCAGEGRKPGQEREAVLKKNVPIATAVAPYFSYMASGAKFIEAGNPTEAKILEEQTMNLVAWLEGRLGKDILKRFDGMPRSAVEEMVNIWLENSFPSEAQIEEIKTGDPLLIAPPQVSPDTFIVESGLDHSRAQLMMALYLKKYHNLSVHPADISKVIILGGHSTGKILPVFDLAMVKDRPLKEIAPEFFEDAERRNEVISNVRGRGGFIVGKGWISVLNTAMSIVQTIRNLRYPTPKGEWYNLARPIFNETEESDYGVPRGLICSRPTKTDKNGNQITDCSPIAPLRKEYKDILQEDVKIQRQMLREIEKLRSPGWKFSGSISPDAYMVLGASVPRDPESGR